MNEFVPIVEELPTGIPLCAVPGGCKNLTDLGKRLTDNEGRLHRIEAKLDKNCEDTTEVLDTLRLAKSFFRLANYFGIFVKWGLGIGAAVLGFWHAWKEFHQ
jgi:hypothetical protein